MRARTRYAESCQSKRRTLTHLTGYLQLACVGALKMLDVKITDQMTGHENAGHEIAGHKREGYETDSEAANV